MDSEKFLNKILSGKKVAIIGPADYVNKELDDDHGSYLDSKFDVVIRLNGMIEIINKDLEKYYGNKFDILMSSFWYTQDNLNSLKNNIKNKEIPRYLVKSTYENIPENTILYEANNRNLFNRIYQMYKEPIDKKKIIYMNSNRLTYLKAISLLNSINKITSTPTTGTLAIALVLISKPKLLYVSGVTTYMDKKHNAYFDGYTRTVDKDSITLNESLNLTDRRLNGYEYKRKNLFDGKNYNLNHPSTKDHPFLAEQKILKYLVTNKFIKVDKYLKKLVKSID